MPVAGTQQPTKKKHDGLFNFVINENRRITVREKTITARKLRNPDAVASSKLSLHIFKFEQSIKVITNFYSERPC